MERKAAEWIRDRLTEAYGPQTVPKGDPLETLVTTILSQNTNDANRDRAYAALLERFGTLERVSRASEAQIEASIRVAGLQSQKARTIRDILRRVRATSGRLDLGFLERMPAADAFAWLQESRGIGTKTASIVLLFSFGRPFFPVDTHVGRVLRRVGAIPEAGDAFRHANDALPRDPQLLLELHLLLIQLGRSLCRPRRPACGSCPILPRCEHGRAAVVGV
ncbi:MAG: endonuclease III [Candidatus Bipolaricaulota bacterium]|nr:endonuclease III [Candidatus Bipolaricaulota bacterium]